MEFARKPLALDRVWRRLISFFDDGPLWPRRIAARGMLRLRDQRMLCWWLRQAGEIARRLLLLEALRLDAPPPVARARRRRAARRPALAYCCEHALEPNAWRVRFRLRSQTARPAGRNKRAARRPRPTLYPAMTLARRAEALWRVLRDRRIYARRLARRLNARANRQSLYAARAAHAVPPRHDLYGALCRKSGRLLAATHVHCAAALEMALARHGLAGWDSS